MASPGWLSVRETGSVFGMRCLVVLCTMWGRCPARLVLKGVALYSVCLNGTARRASKRYLELVGEVPSLSHVYRHILHFAECSLDRLFFLRGNLRSFSISTSGSEHIQKLAESKRGAILLGAHLGSFEAMRAVGEATQANIHIVGYFGNARVVNRVLDEASGGRAGARLLEITPDSLDFIFKAKELLERGEMLAILGDRVISKHFVEVSFLGQKARFPTGPFLLAASVRCPIYLTFGLYHRPGRYELHCEPLVEEVQLPRAQRSEALQAYVQRFADRLAHYCQLAPYNWFNFFPFWTDDIAPKESA